MHSDSTPFTHSTEKALGESQPTLRSLCTILLYCLCFRANAALCSACQFCQACLSFVCCSRCNAVLPCKRNIRSVLACACQRPMACLSPAMLLCRLQHSTDHFHMECGSGEGATYCALINLHDQGELCVYHYGIKDTL